MTSSTPITKVVRVLRNGRITIPADFRRMLPIGEDTMFEVTLLDGGLRIKPVQVHEKHSDAAQHAKATKVRSD